MPLLWAWPGALSSGPSSTFRQGPRRGRRIIGLTASWGTRIAAEVNLSRVTGSTGPVPVSGTSTWIRSGCSRIQGRGAPPVPTRLARRTARSGSLTDAWQLEDLDAWEPTFGALRDKARDVPSYSLQIGVSATLHKKLTRYFTLHNMWSGGDSNSDLFRARDQDGVLGACLPPAKPHLTCSNAATASHDERCRTSVRPTVDGLLTDSAWEVGNGGAAR